MKILIVSDTINPSIYSNQIKEICKDVSFVLSCGDLPFYYLEYIVTMLNKPLFYVFGNHDTFLVRHNNVIQTAPQGCENVNERVIQQHGLLIGGLEGSRFYNGKPYQYTEWQMKMKSMRMLPRLYWNNLLKERPIDILLTHAAPFGIQDGTDHCHQGFKAFNHFMRRFRPRYLIHGHTHSVNRNHQVEHYLETTVVNVAGYFILEMNSEEWT